MLKINTLSNLSFGRKLRENEIEDYRKTIQSSYDVLNKEVGIILHNSSAPTANTSDTGVGSVYSQNCRNMMLPFLKTHGFSSIQVEPESVRKFGDPSPYVSESSAKNTLMGDLELYTTEKYGSLLSQETFDDIVANNPNKNTKRVNFDYVNSKYKQAYSEMWENFKIKKENNSPDVKELSAEFENFKENITPDVELAALYLVFSKENGNDYWQNWENESDVELFKQPKDVQDKRIEEIKEKYSDDIEAFYFTQMLISKTKHNAIEEYQSNGIKIIGDVPVAFSDADTWANGDLFLDDYKMGCPPDYFSPTGQAWGFPVLNPKKIFNSDGSLGKGGEYLFNKYQTLFRENTGGIRIDHAIGLIDPFVYKTNPLAPDAGRLYSTKEGELSQFYKENREMLKDIYNKIIVPAAQSVGLSKDDIISEDLGFVPKYIKDTFKELGIQGISITQYVGNDEIPSRNIVMIGSHDTPTLIEYTNTLYNQGDPYNVAAWKLTEDIMPNASHDKKQAYFDDMRYDYHRAGAREKFNTSKYAQLFTSPAKKVQIFWEDVIGEEERYNKPSTTEGNWELRMGSDFMDSYHTNLQKGHGVNLPEALQIALQTQGDNKNQELIQKLEMYKGILKE